LLLLCACAKGTVADPGTAVPIVHAAPTGALVVTGCTDALPGDANGVEPIYLVDPATGAVSRWRPDGLGRVTTLRSSSRTPALFLLDEQLRSLAPDGSLRVVDAKPDWRANPVGSDGAHRMVITDDAFEWRTFDGKVERRLPVSGTTDRVFPSLAGERAVTELAESVSLVDAHGTTTLLPHALVLSASWSLDGARVALVTTPLYNGAQPADGEAALWRADLDGSAPRRLLLPARPKPDLLSRWLDLPQNATAASAVVWTRDGLAILSNHGSECWSGGQDIPAGCERALYRLPVGGGAPKRISPRAFRCRDLFLLEPS
jgi:hypothetical protein